MSLAYSLLATAALVAFVAFAGSTTYRYGRRDLLHPVVLLNGIMAYFVLVPASYFLVTEFGAVPDRFGLANPARALAIALVVLFGMYIGMVAAFRWRPWGRSARRDGMSALADTFADVNPSVLLVLGLAGFGVGLLAFGFYVVINGGFVRLLTVTPRIAFQTAPNTYRFRVLGLMGVFGGYATTLCALRPALERPDGRLQTPSMRALALAGAVTVLTMLVAVSTRARMVVLVPAFIAVVYFQTAGWLSQHALVAVGAAVVTLGMGFSAVEGLLSGFHIGVVIDTFVRGVVQIPRLALMMVLVERVPDGTGFQLGATLPHAFYLNLPGLPRHGNLVEMIATGTDKDNHLSSAMLPGELWLNFGPVGIAAGAVIYGAALRWAYRLREHAQPIVRGIQPAVLVCILLLWPTNLTWGVPNLFVRVLAPVLVAVGAAIVVQRRLPSLARTVAGSR